MTILTVVLFLTYAFILMSMTVLGWELWRRQEATGRAVRTLAEALSNIPESSPIFLGPDVPGAPEEQPWRPDEPLTKTPTTALPWVVGRDT